MYIVWFIICVYFEFDYSAWFCFDLFDVLFYFVSLVYIQLKSTTQQSIFDSDVLLFYIDEVW